MDAKRLPTLEEFNGNSDINEATKGKQPGEGTLTADMLAVSDMVGQNDQHYKAKWRVVSINGDEIGFSSKTSGDKADLTTTDLANFYPIEVASLK